MKVLKIKERGVKHFRPFHSPQEFESVTGIKLLDPIYYHHLQADSRCYTYAPYLGHIYYAGTTDTKLIFGYRQISLETLFCDYEYSLDNKTWKPFGIDKETTRTIKIKN